jgi:hypothetical protein
LLLALPLPTLDLLAECLYIYGYGRTDSCAVTAAKNEARLLRLLCPTTSQFWMQAECKIEPHFEINSFHVAKDSDAEVRRTASTLVPASLLLCVAISCIA